jgi:hypothetical protein
MGFIAFGRVAAGDHLAEVECRRAQTLQDQVSRRG